MTLGPAVEAGGVRVLHKTLDILETIKSKDAGFKLAELSRTVELPKATVYRILTTLEGRGYLDRASDGTYRMAKKLFDLQRSESEEQILNRVAKPIMERTVEATKETVNLGILDAGEVVVINTVESPQAVRMSSKIGNRRHLHSTALGKIFLAGLPEKEFLRLIRMKGLPRLTEFTLVTKAAVIDEIRRVKKQGWAMDNQENEMEGRCIGAPIVAPDGRVVAALSISGPVFRMDMARATSLVPQLRAFCAEMSAALRVG
ncbi:MAG TPA: IclR family transcriptional regulator [Candidatus Sulfopaludibacter sp.]|jgi:DNA-binding IclR family transcriptional regulator|nr:IclR family transcriptional regulator [Candidatus Sulfopaludibacter sp.]